MKPALALTLAAAEANAGRTVAVQHPIACSRPCSPEVAAPLIADFEMLLFDVTATSASASPSRRSQPRHLRWRAGARVLTGGTGLLLLAGSSVLGLAHGAPAGSPSLLAMAPSLALLAIPWWRQRVRVSEHGLRVGLSFGRSRGCAWDDIAASSVRGADQLLRSSGHLDLYIDAKGRRELLSITLTPLRAEDRRWLVERVERATQRRQQRAAEAAAAATPRP